MDDVINVSKAARQDLEEYVLNLSRQYAQLKAKADELARNLQNADASVMQYSAEVEFLNQRLADAYQKIGELSVPSLPYPDAEPPKLSPEQKAAAGMYKILADFKSSLGRS